MEGKIFELRSLIYGKYNSEAEFAKRLGWPRQRLNKITAGKKEPCVSEVYEIAEGLEEDVCKVFQVFLRFWSPNEQRIIV